MDEALIFSGLSSVTPQVLVGVEIIEVQDRFDKDNDPLAFASLTWRISNLKL